MPPESVSIPLESSLTRTIEGSSTLSHLEPVRQAVLRTILSRLQQDGELCPNALGDILAHNIEPDELTEAGLSYEDVRAIETRLSWGTALP